MTELVKSKKGAYGKTGQRDKSGKLLPKRRRHHGFRDELFKVYREIKHAMREVARSDPKMLIYLANAGLTSLLVERTLNRWYAVSHGPNELADDLKAIVFLTGMMPFVVIDEISRASIPVPGIDFLGIKLGGGKISLFPIQEPLKKWLANVLTADWLFNIRERTDSAGTFVREWRPKALTVTVLAIALSVFPLMAIEGLQGLGALLQGIGSMLQGVGEIVPG